MTPDALKAPNAALEPSAKPCILLFEDFLQNDTFLCQAPCHGCIDVKRSLLTM